MTLLSTSPRVRQILPPLSTSTWAA